MLVDAELLAPNKSANGEDGDGTGAADDGDDALGGSCGFGLVLPPLLLQMSIEVVVVEGGNWMLMAVGEPVDDGIAGVLW